MGRVQVDRATLTRSGPKPRLALIHINNQAVKTRSPVVEVERSARAFMERVGLNTDGGKDYYLFKRELKALAACRMTLGFTSENGPTTLDAKIIKRFEAWFTKDDSVPVFWPGEIGVWGATEQKTGLRGCAAQNV